jgi:hypothetical protein
LTAGGLLFGRAEASPLPFAPDSAAPDGLLGLRRWLEAMGFRVATTAGGSFRIPAGASLLFVYPSETAYNEAEAEMLADWVGAGHTAVLVGPAAQDAALRRTFGVGDSARRSLVGRPVDPTAHLQQRQPLLPDAPAELGAAGVTASLDLEDAPAAVPVLVAAGGPVTLAAQPWGEGTVWHLGARHTLINDQLRSLEESVIVPALVRGVPRGALVVFDTYHLLPREAAEAADSWVGWLTASSPGRAILFAAAAVFLFRLWGGLRLGPPLPAPAALRRREAGEFVSAMAALWRRGRKRAAVAGHHKRRLKIALGRPLRLSPDLPDGPFVARLQQQGGRWDDAAAARLRRVLAGLSGSPSDEELVRLVAEADALDPRPRPGAG